MEQTEKENREQYLSFSDEQKINIYKQIADQYGKEISDSEALEGWRSHDDDEGLISGFPQYFPPETVEALALGTQKSGSEYAPKMVRELARRRDFARVARILNSYSDSPFLDYCMRELDASLSSDELTEIAQMLSDRGRAEKIVEYSENMRQEKVTRRSLALYMKFLHINDEDLASSADRELLLVGGGSSPVKSELSQRGLNAQVTNVDPMPSVNPEETADVNISSDFLDTKLPEDYKEIWALFSLPAYAFDPQGAKDFYTKSLESLAPDGTLRVAPISGFGDSFSPKMRAMRKAVSETSAGLVKKLTDRPDLFEIQEFSTDYKTVWGTRKLRGVSIRIVGDKHEALEYLG